MAPAALGTRAALAALACVMLALGGIGLWRWLQPAAAPAPATAATGIAKAPAGETAGIAALRIRLLPEGGQGADPASVRIGIAEVSPQDAAAWRAWVRGGMQGAGPQAYAEMATVVRWIDAPARRSTDRTLEAGTVEVGPLRLPAADAYVLQAASTDRLRWYDARFTPERIPDALRPQLASGLRLRVAAPGEDGMRGHGTDAEGTGGDGQRAGEAQIALQLRRVEGSRDAGWQPLLRRVAPELLAAYDDTPLVVPAATRAGADPMVAPLPPGPVDAVVLIEGVEVLRRRLTLVAGELATLAVDAESLRRGAALATALRLRFVEAGSGRALRPAEVLWIAPEGERRLGAEADGSYRIARVDPARPLRFDLRMAQDHTTREQAGDLPAWPEVLPLTLRLDEDAIDGTPAAPRGDAGRTARVAGAPVDIVRRVALQPLRWLVVDGLPVEARLRGGRAATPAANAGTPPPVHVLERAGNHGDDDDAGTGTGAGTAGGRSARDADDRVRSVPGTVSGRGMRDAGWHTVAAERFVAQPTGVAVSIQAPGRYRLAVAITPWRILRSAAVDVGAAGTGRGAERVVRTGLAPPTQAPRTVRVRLLGAAGPLARTPVQILDAAGALPPWTLSTDAGGWLSLDAATEAAVRMEAPGHAQALVPLRTAEVALRLQPERE